MTPELERMSYADVNHDVLRSLVVTGPRYYVTLAAMVTVAVVSPAKTVTVPLAPKAGLISFRGISVPVPLADSIRLPRRTT